MCDATPNARTGGTASDARIDAAARRKLGRPHSNVEHGAPPRRAFDGAPLGKEGIDMAWDTEGTKRKILLAAVEELAARGPDGTTIERIAKAAGVNKERVYNYFGAKRELFARVLREEMAKVARAVPISFAVDDVGDYAGRVYDYHREHPQLNRLLLWEGLVLGCCRCAESRPTDGGNRRRPSGLPHPFARRVVGGRPASCRDGLQADRRK